jgi:hypothetical protein
MRRPPTSLGYRPSSLASPSVSREQPRATGVARRAYASAGRPVLASAGQAHATSDARDYSGGTGVEQDDEELERSPHAIELRDGL